MRGWHNCINEVVTKSGCARETGREKRVFFWCQLVLVSERADGSVWRPLDQLGEHLGAATSTRPPLQTYQPIHTNHTWVSGGGS